MTKEQFFNIVKYIKIAIEGSVFEGKTYVVGGSVRDLLLGDDIKDIDICVEMPNGGEALVDFLESSGLLENKVVYPRFGTAMGLLTELGVEIECVQTRGEKYPDFESRKCDTCFASIEDDATRRDLTINAIYFNISTGEYLDIVGGKQDLENGVLRTPRNPDEIFNDDPLRLMRVCRFYSRYLSYGFRLANGIVEAMRNNAGRLGIVSKERIQNELCKMLMTNNAVKGVELLVETKLIDYIFPEYRLCVGLEQNEYHFGDVHQHTMAVLDYSCKNFEPNLVVRLACLLHDIGKTATRTQGEDGRIHFYKHEFIGSKMAADILRELKFDNNTVDEVKFLVENHMVSKQWGDRLCRVKLKKLNKFFHMCGCKERLLNLAQLIECDNESHKEEHCIHGQYEMIKTLAETDMVKWFSYKLPVNGDDVQEVLGMQPGKEIGMVLNNLLKRAFSRPDITKEQCLKMIPSIYKEILKKEKNQNKFVII